MTLRELEAASIRSFVESCSEHFTGRVLDYGCGKSPYRDIVEAAGGEYVGFDRAEYPANVSGEDVGDLPSYVDATICTQVLQYCADPESELWLLHGRMRWGGAPGTVEQRGVLVLTFPTNWPEVEPEDLHRFTASGMTRLLTEAGFTVERMERRAEIANRSDVFALGYGVVARA